MFEGLTQQSVDFLWELALHNQRPWFQDHKEEFQRGLQKPFQALAQATLGLMRERWPQAGLQLHISRIYRDARRLFGRGPYQDNLWFSLEKGDAQLPAGPVFWFELGKDGTSHGVGIWNGKAAQAQALREKIDAAPACLEDILLAIPDRERMRLWGEEYKRPKGEKGPLLDPWYNRKQVSAGYENYFGPELFSPGLPERLAGSFSALKPLYDFLLEAHQMALPSL